MFIIGTAGHVDHGKTLLIKALTGIDTDRLPEEKKRGLTIDLGFAHFKNDAGVEVGIVDVPGHERFIRNMVAGAWGIDLALLVVAADDGWMFQTGNHLRVLQTMGIGEIIAVITKSDAVDAEQLEYVVEDTQLRLLEDTGREHPAISVSALTGSNIPELKQLISTRLEKKPTDNTGGLLPVENSPIMHIDRAFSVRGAGLVVTGSLREGSVRKEDSLLLLPDNKMVRVRGIQSYDAELDTAEPSCRAAFNIIGADAEEVKRGCCLTEAASNTNEDSGFTAETEIIIELKGSIDDIRNHSEAEFAAGTAHSIGSIHFLKRSENQPPLARISLNEPIPLRHGQPVVIIRKGGSLITGSGRVIWKGQTNKEQRISIASSEKTELNNLKLAVFGWAENSGLWQFNETTRSLVEKDIIKLASDAGGIKREELSGKFKMPSRALDQLISNLINSEQLIETDNVFFSGKSKTTLSKNAESILNEIERCGKTGLDTAKTRIPGAKTELRTLTRAGLIIPLTETIFLEEKVFSELCLAVLKNLKSGDTFDIAHTKERTGLSRKYIIPLLLKMEERKMVTREENLRRVL